MTRIPQGDYLTVEEYRVKMGLASRLNVYRAIKEGRIEGVIRLADHTLLIPSHAVMINRTIKHGRYIGLSQWMKGEVEHQEELKNWKLRQAQLKALRGEDKE